MSDILEKCRAGGEWICGRWIGFSDDDRRAAADEIERLRKLLNVLTEDPLPTLDEPDTDCEVVLKMRAIARAAAEQRDPDCCLGLSPAACAEVPSRHCEGWGKSVEMSSEGKKDE